MAQNRAILDFSKCQSAYFPRTAREKRATCHPRWFPMLGSAGFPQAARCNRAVRLVSHFAYGTPSGRSGERTPFPHPDPSRSNRHEHEPEARTQASNRPCRQLPVGGRGVVSGPSGGKICALADWKSARCDLRVRLQVKYPGQDHQDWLLTPCGPDQRADQPGNGVGTGLHMRRQAQRYQRPGGFRADCGQPDLRELLQEPGEVEAFVKVGHR